MSRQAWITPEAEPVDYTCRCILLPAEREWRTIFVGALLNLCNPENWEQIDGVTPAVAVDVFLTIVNDFLDGNDCE